MNNDKTLTDTPQPIEEHSNLVAFWTLAPEVENVPGKRLLAKITPKPEFGPAIEGALEEWHDDPYQWQIEAWGLGCSYLEEEPAAALEMFRRLAERYPHQIRNFLVLADSLEAVGEPELALEAIDSILFYVPDCSESIVKAVSLLTEMGRNWREHRWPEFPNVAELDAAMVERCLAWLDENGAASYLEFRFDMLQDEVVVFEEEELIEVLAKDLRFEQIGEWPFFCWAQTEEAHR